MVLQQDVWTQWSITTLRISDFDQLMPAPTGGVAGFEPDYASIEYSNILKTLFEYSYYLEVLKLLCVELPITTVGKMVVPSIHDDSKADALVYGMGDHSLREF